VYKNLNVKHVFTFGAVTEMIDGIVPLRSFVDVCIYEKSWLSKPS